MALYSFLKISDKLSTMWMKRTLLLSLPCLLYLSCATGGGPSPALPEKSPPSAAERPPVSSSTHGGAPRKGAGAPEKGDTEKERARAAVEGASAGPEKPGKGRAAAERPPRGGEKDRGRGGGASRISALPETYMPQEDIPEKNAPRENGLPGPGAYPELPPGPWVPRSIMGEGAIPPETLADFLRSANPQVESTYARDLARFYSDEAALEGVNSDIAFAQMCLETGFLRFGNLVTPDMNNFCGLGAIGGSQRGASFPSPQMGVRAHIQHLKAYATDEPLKGDLVDPRYRYVRYGSAPTLYGLAGKWASDPDYAEKIIAILQRLYEYFEGIQT